MADTIGEKIEPEFGKALAASGWKRVPVWVAYSRWVEDDYYGDYGGYEKCSVTHEGAEALLLALPSAEDRGVEESVGYEAPDGSSVWRVTEDAPPERALPEAEAFEEAGIDPSAARGG